MKVSRVACSGRCDYTCRCRMEFTNGAAWALHQCKVCGKGNVYKTSALREQDVMEDYYDSRIRQFVLDLYDVWFPPWPVYEIEWPWPLVQIKKSRPRAGGIIEGVTCP